MCGFVCRSCLYVVFVSFFIDCWGVVMSCVGEEVLCEWFVGVECLYGVGSFVWLVEKYVCVIGIGGVGLWVVEVLVCSGVGWFILIDVDEVCVFNINWQMYVFDGEYGKFKVGVMVMCLYVINLQLCLEVIECFFMLFMLDELFDCGYDVVLDVCDVFCVKFEVIVWCCCCKLLMVMVGLVGGCIDFIQICVCDLLCIEYDVMFSLICKKFWQDFNFLCGLVCYFGVLVVYLLQNVQYLQLDGIVCGICLFGGDILNLVCGGGLGVVIYVIGVFVFVVVGKVMEKLLGF